MTTQRKRWGALLAAPLLVGTLAACDPPPPPPVFHVDATDDRHDAAPGDGVCATTVETCTLNAAVEEASALGRGEVLVPPGEYDELAVHVEGHVTVRTDAPGDPTAYASVADLVVGVADDATLLLRDLELGDGLGHGEGILAGGTLVAVRVAVAGQVGVGGAALIIGSLVGDGVFAGPGSDLHVQASTLVASADGPALLLDGGAVTLGGTALLGDGVAVCTVEAGAPAATSIAPNLASDDSCNLTGPGDVNGSPDDDGALFPSPGSPRIDAIPVGTLGCGTTLVSDIRGAVRPTDGDGDGVAACDIGAWER